MTKMMADYGPRRGAESSPPDGKASERHIVRGGIEAKTWLITPAIARELLGRNESNRSISRKKVDQYVAEIVAGEWMLNGETICIGSDGRLLNGQHRLSAVIKANLPIQSLVAENVSPEVFHTYDSGKGRTVGDGLAIAGVGNGNMLAAAARFLLAFEADVMLDRRQDAFTRTQVRNYVLEHEEEMKRAESIARPSFDFMISSLAVAFCVLFRRVDQTMGTEFFERLGDGVALGVGSPIGLLRNTLIREKLNHRSRLVTEEMATLVIRAWNMHFSGKASARILRGRLKKKEGEAVKRPPVAGLSRGASGE